MTLFELYVEALEEKDQARLTEDWSHLQASKALIAFIQIVVERGSLTWEDDQEKLKTIFRQIDTQPAHIAATNRMIEQRVEHNDRQAESDLGAI